MSDRAMPAHIGMGASFVPRRNEARVLGGIDSVKHGVRSNDNHLGRFVGDDCRWSEGHLGSF
jgi:hypothetical protein